MEKLLSQLHIGNVFSYERITGGRDSIVLKVNSEDGSAFAVRILPRDRIGQFRQERHLMKSAQSSGIPVPAVHEVREVDDHAVMVMDWGKGRTVLEELLGSPNISHELGWNFGKMQRRLHDVMPFHPLREQWLSAQTEEESKLYEIAFATNEPKISFLHMDFHPLNVLTEGYNITAVLDWINASTGDYRYDLARTYSILSAEEAREYMGVDHRIITNFREAWLDGYYSNEHIREDLSLYVKWANKRLLREMATK
ncbi:phosphotransferase family protein [Oceanobacillus kapialis]|uniref:phosphotransferase family protein n=1 Tax=Oceanobacillus kapialis TaxID=481353 RepID=UPI00384BC6B9